MLRGFSYWIATRPCPLSRNPPPLPPLPPLFGVFSLLAIALVSCAIWSDMVLICAAIASEDALELSRVSNVGGLLFLGNRCENSCDLEI